MSGLYLSMFTTLKIKAVKFFKYLLHLKILIINLHVKINVLYKKNNRFPKPKTSSETSIVLFLQISLISDFIEDN